MSMSLTTRAPRLFAMRAKWTESGTVGIARRVHALFAMTKSKRGAPADAGVLSEMPWFRQ